MILVDTSVWIDHLRSAAPDLIALLERIEDEALLSFVEARELWGRGLSAAAVSLGVAFEG